MSKSEPPARSVISLDAVAIFVEVVRAKSFSEAARRLGLPKSTVSVRVAELESGLGVSLLHRTTRRVQPTPAGESYFVAASRSVADLTNAAQEAAQAQSEAVGTLRVTSAGNATGNVGEHIAAFLELYPKISVELLLTDQALDILSEGIDVAVRIGTVPDAPNLTARRLGSAQLALYASPAYLRGHRAPAHPSDLSDHAVLLPPQRRELVLLQRGGGRSTTQLAPRFASTHPVALRQQALRGLGIALLPTMVGDEEVGLGSLKRVLPDWTTVPVPVSLVYGSGRYLPHRVRLFVDHVLSHAKLAEKKPERRSRA